MVNRELLVITGSGLAISDLISAASSTNLEVRLSAASLERMRENRLHAERCVERGDVVYGMSTGVGSRKRHRVSTPNMVRHQTCMVYDHALGQGPPLPQVVVRASALLLLNSLAGGRANVRPSTAETIARRLSDGAPLRSIPTYGTTGIGDVVPLSHLAADLMATVAEEDDAAPAADAGASTGRPPLALAPGEALPLIAQSSVTTAAAAVAVDGARRLLQTLTIVAALDVEGFAANPSPYHPKCGEVRPYPGYQQALGNLWELLQGGTVRGGMVLGGSHASERPALAGTEAPRHLQSPLSFRGAAVVLGAAWDALSHCERTVTIELNAHQLNPLALGPREGDCMLPCAHYDMQALASSLDFGRLGLAPCLTAQLERSIKMLQAKETDLPTGLAHWDDDPATSHGLSEIAFTLQPVSAEVGSATQADGIEDRITMAALSARQLSQLIKLSHSAAAISATIACQAIDLRPGGAERLGPRLRGAYNAVRTVLPTMVHGAYPPQGRHMQALADALDQGMLYNAVWGRGGPTERRDKRTTRDGAPPGPSVCGSSKL